MNAKYKIGDEVTVSRLRGPRKIEAVKEQYYIRDEGWFDACALTPYARPLAVGDRVLDEYGDDGIGIVRLIEGNEAVLWLGQHGFGIRRNKNVLQRDGN